VTEEAAFCARDTAEPVVFQDTMWLSNGYLHGRELVRDLWRSPDGCTWSQVSESTPYDGYSELVVFRDEIWAVKDSVWRSADGLSWTQVCAHTPFGARGYGELVVFRDRMWQLGSGRDVWHSEDGVHWEQAVAEVYGGRLWMIGGFSNRQSVNFAQAWHTRDGESWEQGVSDPMFSPRHEVSPYVFEDSLWVVGGNAWPLTNDVWKLTWP